MSTRRAPTLLLQQTQPHKCPAPAKEPACAAQQHPQQPHQNSPKNRQFRRTSTSQRGPSSRSRKSSARCRRGPMCNWCPTTQRPRCECGVSRVRVQGVNRRSEQGALSPMHDAQLVSYPSTSKVSIHALCIHTHDAHPIHTNGCMLESCSSSPTTRPPGCVMKR